LTKTKVHATPGVACTQNAYQQIRQARAFAGNQSESIMIKTTRAQRQALLRVYNRAVVYVNPITGTVGSNRSEFDESPLTFRQFRQRVMPTFNCDSCIMIQWCGMWVGIEVDGYCHT
jgi:hypothetical protein